MIGSKSREHKLPYDSIALFLCYLLSKEQETKFSSSEWNSLICYKQSIDERRSMLCLNSSSGLPALASSIGLHCIRLLSTIDASINMIATRLSSRTTSALAISLA